MKKAVSLFICVVFFVCAFAVDADALGTSAQAHVLMDAKSGLVLSGSNEHIKMKMASTTKIMTTLLALEEAEKKDRTVTFTSAMMAEGSSMYLKLGDRVRLSDLAAGMMMASGNDAANAVALTLSDSFDGFATLMNQRAESIGMENTNFVTPSGLDDEDHYSTAYDMALLMVEALKNEDFKVLSASKEKRVEFITPSDKVSLYPNHNRLLNTYKYCTGGKTGYTKAAGRCLVTTAEKDGVELIAVTLNAPDDWSDHKSLYEYGFSLYTKVEADDNEIYRIKVSGGNKGYVQASADEAADFSVPANRIKDIKKKVYLPGFVFAPVNEGDIAGKIIYTLDGIEVATTYLRMNNSVKEITRPNLFVRIINVIFNRD